MSLSLWTLGAIKTKVRALTGRRSTNQLSNVDLVSYINRYYQLVFPMEAQPMELESWFTFSTVIGTDGYDLTTLEDTTVVPSKTFYDGFLTLNEPVTLDGGVLNLYLNPTLFYERWPTSITYSNSTPTDVLYYGKKLLFRNPPIAVSTVRFGSWSRPDGFVDGVVDAVPGQEEWGAIIAYGAAVEIAEDEGDVELASMLEGKKQENIIKMMRKRHVQEVNQRALPKF